MLALTNVFECCNVLSKSPTGSVRIGYGITGAARTFFKSCECLQEPDKTGQRNLLEVADSTTCSMREYQVQVSEKSTRTQLAYTANWTQGIHVIAVPLHWQPYNTISTKILH